MRWPRCAHLLAGAWICATLLAACAHRVPSMEADTAGPPASVELTDTPFFPQARYQCGPAALATVLNARGVTIAPDDLVPQVYLPGREGSLQAEIITAVRRQGLLAVAVEPALDALLTEIAAGHPVLVLQNMGLNWLPRWHYAVASGRSRPPRAPTTRRVRRVPGTIWPTLWLPANAYAKPGKQCASPRVSRLKTPNSRMP